MPDAYRPRAPLPKGFTRISEYCRVNGFTYMQVYTALQLAPSEFHRRTISGAIIVRADIPPSFFKLTRNTKDDRQFADIRAAEIRASICQHS